MDLDRIRLFRGLFQIEPIKTFIIRCIILRIHFNAAIPLNCEFVIGQKIHSVNFVSKNERYSNSISPYYERPDYILFPSDLKKWTKESEFGEKLGIHGGVLEFLNLFPLELNGENHWVLLVNINPGGPGGSATQHFT